MAHLSSPQTPVIATATTTLISKPQSPSSCEGGQQLSHMLIQTAPPCIWQLNHMSPPKHHHVNNATDNESSTVDSCADAFQDAVSSSFEGDNAQEDIVQHKSNNRNKDHLCITSQPESTGKHKHVSQLQQWLDAREAELQKREAAVRTAQSDYRKQTQSLRLDLERKEAELNVMQQRINSLVKAKVDLQEELEMTKVQAKFKQAELQQEILCLQREISQGDKGGAGMAHEIGELKEYIQQLKSQNQSLMVELDAFSEQEKERYSQQSLHQEELTHPPISDNHRIQELEDELSSERETCVELREQLMAVRQELNGKVDNLEMQLQLQRMKSAQAEAQLVDSASSTANEPSLPVSQSAPPAASTEQNNAHIEQMAMKYAEELQEAEMRAGDAEMRLDQLSRALSHKEDEMAEVQKNLVTLRKNLLGMNNQVVSLTSQVNDLQNRLRAKSGQLEIAHFQVDRYRKQVDRSRQIAQSHKLSSLLFLGYLGPRIVSIGNNLHAIDKTLTYAQTQW